jgi:Domain of unknown function (DUF4139)/N-terminal domain of unknown function (DUF4140)
MRKMYIASATILSASMVVFLGSRYFTNAQEAVASKEAVPENSRLAKSRIDRVTVYPDSALVTREVVVPAGKGLIELVVKPMPEHIVPKTMYCEADEGVRVLTTRYSTRQVFEDTSADRRALEAKKEELLVVAARINSDIAAVSMNANLLSRLENVTEKKDHTGDDIIAMSKYVMAQRTEKAKELVDLHEQKRQNDQKIAFTDRKMAELGSGPGREEREAIISVDRGNGSEGTIRLNYLVAAVTWRPEYKLRAGKVNEGVQVNYLANLMQNSGEDWSHVKISLSTAQPMLNAAPPELCMLEPVLQHRGAPAPGHDDVFAMGKDGKASDRLRKEAGELRSQASSSYNSFDSKSQKDADILTNKAAALEQNWSLMQSRDEVLAQAKKKQFADPAQNDGPSVTYHLPNKLSVPNRRDEQILEIAKLNLTPKYYYKAVPVLNRHVYRLADLVNKSSHVLLPGEATIFQGTDFVGRMPMPLVAVGEEFTAGFGVDTQLQIQRQMIDQIRSTQGGNQVIKYDYRILVSSYKSESVKLQLWDRLPKGVTETIGIHLGKVAPDLSKDAIYLRESSPSNLLRWDLEVPANCNGENAFAVTYDFRMELDRQMAITGFLSR